MRHGRLPSKLTAAMRTAQPKLLLDPTPTRLRYVTSAHSLFHLFFFGFQLTILFLFLQIRVKQEQIEDEGEQSEDELEQQTFASDPAKKVGDTDSQRQDEERRSDFSPRSISLVNQMSRGGIDTEEIRKAERDREAYNRAYDACMKHKRALNYREEAELRLVSADKDQQRHLNTQLHVDSAKDVEDMGFRHWKKAEDRYEKVKEELVLARRQEEDAQRLLRSYMGDISEEKAAQIRDKVDNLFLRERQDHRSSSYL